MNVLQAAAAIAQGHKVRDKDGAVFPNATGDIWLYPRLEPYELATEPATDAELVAEMRRLRDRDPSAVADAFEHCARMLETRKVKP